MRPDARAWLAAGFVAAFGIGFVAALGISFVADVDEPAGPGDNATAREADDGGGDAPEPVDRPAGPEPDDGAPDASDGSEEGGESAELPPIEGFPQTGVVLLGPDGERIDVAVHVAADGPARSRGLMEVEDLPEDAGMLFVFPSARRGGFYMFNTVLPLSIGFFADDGELLEILDMDPCPSEVASECEIFDPGVAYRSALEVHQGYFDERGIEPGWLIEHDDIPAS